MPLGHPQRAQVNRTIIELLQGDITHQSTDAIVNAANSSLLGGGGVDGAIHRAAGPGLLEETRQIGGCKTGDAKITKGYNLKARHVIHTVGPVYQAAGEHAPRLLASAYRRSLEVALQSGITTISFPSVSTGIYGYPIVEAAPIALRTVIEFALLHETITYMSFVLFDERTYDSFSAALYELGQQMPDKLRLL